MPRIFTAKPLTPQDAARAYPLVQTLAPKVSLAEWTAFVTAAAADGAAAGRVPMGVTIIESDQGYIHGLFSYIAAPDLRHGRALLVDNVIALDLVETQAAERALCDAMERIARDHGCTALHIHVPEPRTAKRLPGRPSLRVVGKAEQHVEGRRICKTFLPRYA